MSEKPQICLQSALSEGELMKMLRQSRRWAGAPRWADVCVTSEPMTVQKPGGVVTENILTITVEYEESAGHQFIKFTTARCGHCGRLFLVHPYMETAACPYRGCERKHRALWKNAGTPKF